MNAKGAGDAAGADAGPPKLNACCLGASGWLLFEPNENEEPMKIKI